MILKQQYVKHISKREHNQRHKVDIEFWEQKDTTKAVVLFSKVTTYLILPLNIYDV